MSDTSGKERKKSFNPGGRPKGIPNKSSMMVKDIVAAHVKGEPVQHLLNLIDQLPTEQQAYHYDRLMPYMHARLSQIEHSGTIDNSTNVDVAKLTELLIKMKMESL